MPRIGITALLASLSLALYGCMPAHTSVAPGPEPWVKARTDGYPEGGYVRPAKDYTSVEDVRLKLPNGYVLKVFDVRQMTMPIADFRGPSLGLSTPRNLPYSSYDYFPYVGGYGGYGGGGYGDYGGGYQFEPFYGISNDLFYGLDLNRDLRQYLLEGLEYDESPYDKATERRRASLVAAIMAATGDPAAWKADPNVSIVYNNGLLVIRQKAEVMDAIEVLIAIMRASPGK